LNVIIELCAIVRWANICLSRWMKCRNMQQILR